MTIRPATYALGVFFGAAVLAASSFPAAAHAPSTNSAPAAAVAQKAKAQCGYYGGSATTRRGDSGPRVKEVQCIINLWNGGEPLQVDGVYGARTESWVVYFQDVRGLNVDGIVGPQTWASLRSV